jgi:ribose transport system permease protein
MKKIFGILGVLLVVVMVTGIMNPNFFSAYNITNTFRWIGLYGIISIGVAFVIITGGIDLSIGSVIGLTGVILPILLVGHGWPIWACLSTVLVVSLLIGAAHGLLITKLKLQPFVVTLCGLLIYRGLARWVAGDETKGFGTDNEGFRQLAIGKIPFIGEYQIPVAFLILVGLSIMAAIFLNKTIYGRYMLALGRNEDAAKYSGIQTDRMILLAYVICGLTAGIGGILFALDVNSIQPSSHGNFYELYAIAAAVLGGCSLRGGEGAILGVLIGTALMRVLNNAIIMLGIPSELEFAVIGIVILLGVTIDELVKRMAAKRRAIREAQMAEADAQQVAATGEPPS